MITHTTLLFPKVEATDEMLEGVFKSVHALQKQIPCLIAVATGENQSTAHRGYTHGIVLHFVGEAHMRDEQTNPTYQKVQQKVSNLCQHVVSFEVAETILLPIVQAPPVQEEAIAPKQRGRKPRTPPSAATYKSRPSAYHSPGWMGDLKGKYVANTVDPRLKHIVIDQLEVDESEVVPSTSLVEDLNADSLDLLEFYMSLEKVFKIQISDEDAEFIRVSRHNLLLCIYNRV
jgi:acyl carrier protein